MYAQKATCASLHDQLVDLITLMRLSWSAPDAAGVISPQETAPPDLATGMRSERQAAFPRRST